MLGLEVGERFHPHIFRHHFATHWYDKGLREQRLSELMGHVKWKTTKGTYIHSNKIRRVLYEHPMDYIDKDKKKQEKE